MNILEKIKNERKFQLKKEMQNLKKPSLKESLFKKDLGLIAEFKKASPSKGLLTNDFNLEKLANKYINANACAFSVLTEEKFFQGGNENLYMLSKKYKNIPCLRKDFIFTPFMVGHSKFLGASVILLIVSILKKEQLFKLHKLALDFKLDILVEIHDKHDLKTALKIPNLGILGINNRNLNTFDVSLETSFKLMKKIPNQRDFAIVSESGFSKLKQLKSIENAGFDGVLVGEAMIKGGLR